MGIFILPVQKSHSYIHKKEAELNVFRPLHLFYLIKILFRSLINRFFNTLAGSTLFHTLDS